MGALARNQASDCANPVLDIFTAVNGVLTDVAVLEFQIFDISDPAKVITPVQVFPLTAGLRETVAVGTLCPTSGAGKLTTGRFVATYAPVIAEPLGTHRIKWFYKLTPTSPEQSFCEDFEVLPEATATGDAGYCLVSDLRDEGITTAMATDAFLLKRIALASRFVDRATGQFFEPRTLALKLDGRGGRMMLLHMPIIAVSSVEFETSPFFPSSLAIETDLLRVYNRHISQGLVQPDDRNNPKIELFHAGYDLTHSALTLNRLIFPRGQQNITINGVFGYTDPAPPSLTGKTPELICHATKLIVMRELAKMVDVAKRRDAQERYRLTSERTRDQSYNLEGLGALKRSGGLFTGDPTIDHILASYMRPPMFGAAGDARAAYQPVPG